MAIKIIMTIAFISCMFYWPYVVMRGLEDKFSRVLIAIWIIVTFLDQLLRLWA